MHPLFKDKIREIEGVDDCDKEEFNKMYDSLLFLLFAKPRSLVSLFLETSKSHQDNKYGVRRMPDQVQSFLNQHKELKSFAEKIRYIREIPENWLRNQRIKEYTVLAE